MPVITVIADVIRAMWTFCTTPAGLLVLAVFALLVMAAAAVCLIVDDRRRRAEEADLIAAWAVPACCDGHRVDDCCDPEDCGPCCSNCPTCPTLRRTTVPRADAMLYRPGCACCGGDPRIVCSACGEHACWAGLFMCEDAQTAGTRTVDREMKADRE